MSGLFLFLVSFKLYWNEIDSVFTPTFKLLPGPG